MDLDDLFADVDVVGVGDLADALDVTPAWLRDRAQEYGVPMIGNAYAFTYETAADLAEELEEDADCEPEDDQDEEDETDEDGCDCDDED